jgi:hypothetical protein
MMQEVNTLYQDGDGRPYCADCGSYYVVSPEEDEAYRDMYEALKFFVNKHSSGYIYLDRGIGTSTEHGKSMLAARKALAKAEGGK